MIISRRREVGVDLWAYMAIAATGFASGLLFKAPMLVVASVLLMTVVSSLGVMGGLPLSHILQHVLQAVVLLQAMYIVGVIGSTFRRGDGNEP